VDRFVSNKFISGKSSRDTACYREHLRIGHSDTLAKSESYSLCDVKFGEISDNAFLIHDFHSCSAELTDSIIKLNLTTSLYNLPSLSGQGIAIELKRKQYKMTTFYWSDDNGFDGKKELIIPVIKDSLVLNRDSFQKGDTIFGELFLRTNTVGYFNDKRKIYSSGRFRTIIK
jgi:hypothetical protein